MVPPFVTSPVMSKDDPPVLVRVSLARFNSPEMVIDPALTAIVPTFVTVPEMVKANPPVLVRVFPAKSKSPEMVRLESA